MALGARRPGVVLAVLRDGLAMTGLGVVIGLLLARSAAGLVSGLLFGVTAGEPGIYAGVAAGILLVTTLACGAPAYRASRVPPTEALRDRGAAT
jgi:ABC-type antimicrobial peptide transport system permease subunit